MQIRPPWQQHETFSAESLCFSTRLSFQMSEDARLLQINCCIKLQLDSPFFFFFFCLNSTVPGLYISTRKLICTINVWLRESFGHTLVARKVKPKTCCSFYADSFKWKSFSYSNYSTSLFRICLCCNLRKYFNISVHQSFRNMHHSSLDTLSTLFIISWLFKQRQENEQHGNKEHKWGIEILNWKWILFIFKQPAMI